MPISVTKREDMLTRQEKEAKNNQSKKEEKI
jgi:hypothetical protein